MSLPQSLAIEGRERAPAAGWDFWIAALPVLAFESWLIYAIVVGDLLWWIAAAMHAVAMVGLAGWCWTMIDRSAVQNLLLLITATAAGPIGAAGAILAAVLLMIFRRFARPFEEWYRDLFPEEAVGHAEAIYQRLVSGREGNENMSSLTSFTDILRLGTREQKEAVITLLTRNFRPAFAHALKLALQDETPSIRVQAATAASEIESQFLDRMIALTEAQKASPDDFGAALELARHYDDYSYCGLLDADREGENRRQTLQFYRLCHRLRPDDAEVRAAIGRCLVRAGDYPAALDFLERSVRDGFHGRALIGWYVECLFALGRYTELKSVAERFRGVLLPDRTGADDGAAAFDPMPGALNLWLGAREKAA